NNCSNGSCILYRLSPKLGTYSAFEKKIDELIKYHEFIEKAIVYIKTRIFSLVSIKNNTKMEDNVFYTSYILPKIKHIEKHCEELDHYIENFFVLSKFFGNFSIPN